jgi:ABC-type multidrug transport system ATPase subunit
VLGEGGPQISGGERQRIAIARAFLKDAPILLLDEPTASVDLRTESGILDALDRLVEGRTTFVIAHRLSTLRNVDSVLVLDRGRVVESGPPAELMARNGLYSHLNKLQRGAAVPRTRAAVNKLEPSAPVATPGEIGLGFPELWRLRAARVLLDEVRARLEERPQDWVEAFEAQQESSDPDVQLALAVVHGSLLGDPDAAPAADPPSGNGKGREP